MSSLSLIGMGLGIDKQRRDKFVKHYNAFVEPGVKLKAPEIVLCDAPALLRKTAPPIPIQPLAVARRFLKNHLLPAAETLCIFFDTPEFHHEMRAAVAQARAEGCKITPYPEEEVLRWTLTSQIEVARAMARPAHKKMYYSLFYEALIQTTKQHLPETVQTVVIDGPRPNDDVVVLNLHPLSDDGRAKLTTWSEMRLANYGEADLKVAKWIASQKNQLQGKLTEWRTIDTDSIAQSMLLRPILDDVLLRLWFPPQGKGSAVSLIDTSKFPKYNTESLVFCLLLPGCDYTNSALGNGFDVENVLLSAGCSPAFRVDKYGISVNTTHLASLCAQLHVPNKKPRSLYMCSGGVAHLSKQAAVRHSLPGWVPQQVPRTTEHLTAEILKILRVIWYWKFAGDDGDGPAGPKNVDGSAEQLFGEASLNSILNGGVVGPEVDPSVVFGRAPRSRSPSPSAGFKKPFVDSKSPP